MGFVIEEIPESQKGNYGLNSRWPIDHERNAFLVVTGGVPEARFYDLFWGDDVINIAAQNTYKAGVREGGSDHEVLDVNISMHHVTAPRKLQKNEKEMFVVITEALTIAGFGCSPIDTGEVTIENLNESIVQYVEKPHSKYRKLGSS